MKEVTLIVRTDEGGARTIDRIVQEHGGSPGIVTQPNNLDGDVTAWIVAISAVVQAFPPLLTAIKDLVSRDKVKSIQVGDIKLDNPTPEIVERTLKEQLGRTDEYRTTP
jgi:hypothetical protein